MDEIKVNRGKRIEDYSEKEWAEIQEAKIQEQAEEETRQINLKM